MRIIISTATDEEVDSLLLGCISKSEYTQLTAVSVMCVCETEILRHHSHILSVMNLIIPTRMSVPLLLRCCAVYIARECWFWFDIYTISLSSSLDCKGSVEQRHPFNTLGDQTKRVQKLMSSSAGKLFYLKLKDHINMALNHASTRSRSRAR